jgi:hypothetical protein
MCVSWESDIDTPLHLVQDIFCMNAQTRIAQVESDILYRKVGKRYVPINDPNAYHGLDEGYWLVKVAPGCTSIRQCVYPDRAEIQAAAHKKQDKLMDIIRKAGEARPTKTKLTKSEREDWETFIAKHGKSFNMLAYPSLHDVAEQIVEELLKKD